MQDLRIVGSMHERKALMTELSDGFIAAPGGFGTLDELFEALTWGQLGFHHKPCGVLDVEDFYAPLIAHLDASVTERFIKPKHRGMLAISEDPGALIDEMARFVPPDPDKWVDRDAS